MSKILHALLVPILFLALTGNSALADQPEDSGFPKSSGKPERSTPISREDNSQELKSSLEGTTKPESAEPAPNPSPEVPNPESAEPAPNPSPEVLNTDSQQPLPLNLLDPAKKLQEHEKAIQELRQAVSAANEGSTSIWTIIALIVDVLLAVIVAAIFMNQSGLSGKLSALSKELKTSKAERTKIKDTPPPGQLPSPTVKPSDIDKIAQRLQGHDQELDNLYNLVKKLEFEQNNLQTVPSQFGGQNFSGVVQSSSSKKIFFGATSTRPTRQNISRESLSQRTTEPDRSIADLTRAFNDIAATPDRERRKTIIKDFIESNNVVGVTCTNAEQRPFRPNDPPRFEKSQSLESEIWAVSLRDGMLAIFPNIPEYEESSHKYGGLKELFRSNYKGGNYNKISVIRPAIVTSTFEIKAEGELQLSIS